MEGPAESSAPPCPSNLRFPSLDSLASSNLDAKIPSAPPPLPSNVRRSSSSTRSRCPSASSSRIRRSSSARTASSPLIRRIHESLRGTPPYNSERSLRHYLTKEVLPHADHYRSRMSFQKGHPDSSRPTLEELLTASRSSSLKLANDTFGSMMEPCAGPDDPTKSNTCREDRAPASGNKEHEPTRLGLPVLFGWVEGVYVPCLLSIWGAMLFLRLTWVVGQAGLIEGLAVITVCNMITAITAMSMSAVSTNGKIRAGGIYYMISRSLGPEFGGAVGITFTVASSISVSMHIIGFCESLLDMLRLHIPSFNGIIDSENRINDVRLVGAITLIVILAITIVGLSVVSRVQISLLVLLIVSQLDFIIGTFLEPTVEERAKGFVGYSAETFKSNLWSDYASGLGFFGVLAVFFPAVTGIVAGANISGELKDPGKAIPKGTLLAILTTYISYIVYGCLIAATGSRFAPGPNGTSAETCMTEKTCEYGISINQQMMEVMSAWGPFIFAGCFAASLSSSIAALVGGPRVFQAVAKDKLFPGISMFAHGWGKNNEPVRGYFLVFFIALGCILIGDLNQVSSLLSNFFVSTYAIINYAVFHASMNRSPGWRPGFHYFNKWISLLGTVLCIAVMVLMDYKTSLVTLICIILLYVFVRTRSPQVNWGSSSQSQSFVSALKAVQTLARVDDHVKNYRPKLLVMAGNPADRPPLVDFANLITKRISLLELVNIVTDNVDLSTMQAMRSYTDKWLRENRIKAFYSLTRNASFCEGVRTAIELSGLGKLSPNMMLIGFQEHWWMYPRYAEEYFQTLQLAFDLHLAVGVLRVNGGLDISDITGAHERVMEATHRQLSDHSAFSLSNSMAEAAPEAADDSSVERASHGSSLPDFKIFDAFRKKSTRNSADLTYGLKEGNPIDERIISRLTQFRDKTSKEGVIDVYWLYDDGGLTLLLPHILTTRAKFAKCKLRVYFLTGGSGEEDGEKAKSMGALLSKFRIEFQDVILLSDATKKPSRQTKDDFKRMVSVPPKPTPIRSNLSTSSMDSVRSLDFSSHRRHQSSGSRDDAPPPFVSESDMAAHLDKTNFQLRIAEIARENSKEASLVVMTLPMPKRGLPHSLYLAWLDFTTRNMPPFLFVRGNQESVLTFYS